MEEIGDEKCGLRNELPEGHGAGVSGVPHSAIGIPRGSCGVPVGARGAAGAKPAAKQHEGHHDNGSGDTPADEHAVGAVQPAAQRSSTPRWPRLSRASGTLRNCQARRGELVDAQAEEGAADPDEEDDHARRACP